jgi:hypothetical protein
LLISSSADILYIVILLSSPPQVTNDPDGEYAQVITQVVGIVTTCSLFVLNASHITNFPSLKKNLVSFKELSFITQNGNFETPKKCVSSQINYDKAQKRIL